jgi:hypothetical protein
LNLNNFKMIEFIGLKIIASRSPWMVLPPTKFHEILPGGPKVIIEGHRQIGNLISLLSKNK